MDKPLYNNHNREDSLRKLNFHLRSGYHLALVTMLISVILEIPIIISLIVLSKFIFISLDLSFKIILISFFSFTGLSAILYPKFKDDTKLTSMKHRVGNFRIYPNYIITTFPRIKINKSDIVQIIYNNQQLDGNLKMVKKANRYTVVAPSDYLHRYHLPTIREEFERDDHIIIVYKMKGKNKVYMVDNAIHTNIKEIRHHLVKFIEEK